MTTSTQLAHHYARKAITGAEYPTGVSVNIGSNEERRSIVVDAKMHVQINGQLLVLNKQYQFPVADILIMHPDAFNERVRHLTVQFAQRINHMMMKYGSVIARAMQRSRQEQERRTGQTFTHAFTGTNTWAFSGTHTRTFTGTNAEGWQWGAT